MTASSGDTSGSQYLLMAPAAKYSGTTRLQRPQASVAADIGLTAAKLMAGNTVLGIAGTAKGELKFASGTQTTGASGTLNVSGMAFEPLIIQMYSTGSATNTQTNQATAFFGFKDTLNNRYYWAYSFDYDEGTGNWSSRTNTGYYVTTQRITWNNRGFSITPSNFGAPNWNTVTRGWRAYGL